MSDGNFDVISSILNSPGFWSAKNSNPTGHQALLAISFKVSFSPYILKKKSLKHIYFLKVVPEI